MDPLGVALLADGQPTEPAWAGRCEGCDVAPWQTHAAECPVMLEREELEGLAPDGWAGP
jgi:hypothetical protein